MIFVIEALKKLTTLKNEYQTEFVLIPPRKCSDFILTVGSLRVVVLPEVGDAEEGDEVVT